MAVVFALKSFPHLANHVQVLTDNITTAAYINHLGGSSNTLSPLVNAIWMEAYNNNITLQAKYLPGTRNLMADALSRVSTQYEWQLHPALFRYVDQIFGPNTIDRFASLTTAQLPLYNSLYRDPKSCSVQLDTGSTRLEPAQLRCTHRFDFPSTACAIVSIQNLNKNPKWRLYAWKISGKMN